jgi:hypothetical protein
MLFPAALAQNPVPGGRLQFQGIHPQPKAPAIVPAHSLLVLSTGRPLTGMDKSQFAARAANVFRSTPSLRNALPPGKSAPAPRTAEAAQATPATFTITPDQMVSNGLIGAAYGVAEWDPADGDLLMDTGSQCFLGLQVIASPNMLYVLVVKVHTYSLSPQFTVAPYNSQSVTTMPGQTLNLAPDSNGVTEFAFAFDAASAGSATIVVSANVRWDFLSAELTAQSM